MGSHYMEVCLIPFVATFMTFSDYKKNAMRLSALSPAGVIHVLTHDSIGRGEDGPTHQTAERLVGLRAMRHLLALRPADGNETAGAYKIHFVLVRLQDQTDTSLALWHYQDKRRSSRSWYYLRKSGQRVSVETGSPIGWKKYVGEKGIVHGVDELGASGTYLHTIEKYGFTEEKVTRLARSLLEWLLGCYAEVLLKRMHSKLRRMLLELQGHEMNVPFSSCYDK
ncbi:uncharacterized protein A4U43_C04F18240 [Asparagus officinalis]|uniref:Uncharacterized protein n=1 Tax=Asparagus officinalis TaxID=4686 RepID=A0A5P1F2D0_ASPOF|nr:uncharacterized protein A4U43_C04F18240 [Asparagus officinalis]